MLPAASRVLQTLDHVAIYMLIAGSYSPYLLIALHQSVEARVLTGALWIVAVGGSVFSAISDLNSPYINGIECCIFLGMGFALFFIWNIFMKGVHVLELIAISGALYAGGVAFYVLGNYRPIYHVLWHTCVLIAAVVMWFDIYLFVIATPSFAVKYNTQ